MTGKKAGKVAMTRQECIIVVSAILLSAVESEWHWQPVDRSFSLPIIPSGGIKELTSKFDLCVTGEVKYLD